MLTESQRRALRAKRLLDMGGNDPKTVARECGYTSVNAMLGAIAMCDGLREEKSPFPARASVQAVAREEHAKRHPFREEQSPSPTKGKVYRTSNLTLTPDGPAVTAAIYPVESGKIIIRKDDIVVSYRPESDKGPTVHINDETGFRRTGHPRWLALVGKDIGGRMALARVLRQISEATLECAKLIENDLRKGR